uniref:Sec1 family domain-containing protein 1 n=1 Tax=Branchiostoma floridae TaxID=7739 RepID=C3ZXF0_BRAFL|eukprot:XP_002586764.1 hypothetical protein BRAFLDRAFT_281337 [Branchiostoma floridae]
MAASIREKQTASLKRMLNLNLEPSRSSAVEPVWKVLVYDRFGQDIISPILSVPELRDMGVTLHLLLHSDRDPIPDVPAVYFVMPSEENVQRICQRTFVIEYCMSKQVVCQIVMPAFDDLSSGRASLHGADPTISLSFDPNNNFIHCQNIICNMRICVLNAELLLQTSSHKNFVFSRKLLVFDTIEQVFINKTLFCSFCPEFPPGTVPIIRSPRGNAAEMVAEKLDKKLRENIRDSRNSLFTSDSLQAGQFSFQRPLLVILDRNLDLATPLHHTWTYQALAHDVLDLQLNRVMVEEPAGDKSPPGARPKKKAKSYDLNFTDKFWQSHKGSPFPEVAEAVQRELEEYRSQEDEVKRLKSVMGLEGEDEGAISMLSDNTAKLTSAVSSLPELLEKKRLIDMHTNIASALLDHIKVRKLDVYFEMEEKMMSKQSLDKSLMDMFSDPEAGSPEDKMRLFIIYFICSAQTMSDADIDQYAVALQAANCDLAPLHYIKRWKAFTKMTAAPSQYGGGGTKTISMFSRLMNTGSEFVMEGVKNLVVKKHNLPVTRVADALIDNKSYQDTEDYRYFDPKMLRVTDSSIPRNRNPVQEVILFIIRHYGPYGRTIDSSSIKRITYGCSELSNATLFLKQVCQLGHSNLGQNCTV